jgi:hypothetical protein
VASQGRESISNGFVRDKYTIVKVIVIRGLGGGERVETAMSIHNIEHKFHNVLSMGAGCRVWLLTRLFKFHHIRRNQIFYYCVLERASPSAWILCYQRLEHGR